jgi:sensor c-di-GMP phosphodiesterase-like protein
LIGHSGELLLVRTRQGNSHVLAATSLDTILYDFMPGDIRDFSMAKIALTGGDIVASFIGASAGHVDATGDVQRFVATSNRFPFAVEIAIPEHVLSSWGEGDTNRLAIAGGLIGLLASGLVAALVLRARTARDDLLDAISSGQIIPHYQPIFSLDNGGLSGCEALARWIRSDGSRIGPDRFIPLAESEGLVAHLTLHLATACARDLGPLCRDRPDFKLSINVPPDLLLTEEFIRALAAAFHKENLPLGNVVLELTERQSIQDLGAVKATMALARDLGFRFALDDTGVGHNGLSNVHSLPVDFIKIDKCFIDMIDKSPESASVVRMLVSLARDLSMKTVAEGIERVEQMTALRDLGVDEGQGYIAAPALAPDQFIDLAMEWFVLEVDRHVQAAPADAKRASKVGGMMNDAA